MSRAGGQIPPYGKHFRRESVTYHPDLANRVYVLKTDGTWFLRSDKTSKVWTIFWGPSIETAVAMGKPLPSLTAAMAKLLDGIKQGFYQVATPARPDDWHCGHERQAAIAGEWRTDQDWAAHCATARRETTKGSA